MIALESGERVEIYANAAQNNARLRKRILLVGVPSFAYIGLMGLAAHDPLFLLTWLFLAVEYTVIYRVMSRATAKQTRPAVTLTTDGIAIHTLYQDIGLVRWDEIKSIRAYNCIYRYVGIVPADTKALCRRLSSKAAFLIRTNDVFRPIIAPINLAQQMLPISAEDLVKKIEVFQLENRV